jgi:hypothetical protein
MACFVRLLMVIVICAPGLHPAEGAERVGDALAVYAFQDRTQAAAALEREILDVIEGSPQEDRFELYRAYSVLVGTWVQVDLSQTLIGEAVSATSPSQEEELRVTLRDQAQFALWELDEAILYLERSIVDADPRELTLNEAIRSLLAETRPIFGRLLADQ